MTNLEALILGQLQWNSINLLISHQDVLEPVSDMLWDVIDSLIHFLEWVSSQWNGSPCQ